MDSCNSGSMQSSSCGDEEYDSRAESNISAFLNTATPAPPLTTQHHHHNLMFSEYPSSNYSPSQPQPQPQPHPNQNPLLLNLEMVWSNSKPPRSEPNQPDLGTFMMGPCNSSSSSSPQNHQAFLLNHQFAGQTSTRGVGVVAAGTTVSVPTTHLPPESGVSRGGGLLPANDHQSLSSSNNTNTNMVRNPKKRSRASRRAPTTVLTTDTTNFRAMVQEFTGIPAPPFTSSSLPFPRTRLDLFGSAASTSSAIRSFDPHPTPPYLLRPFAQKLQPFSPSSSMVNNLASNNISTTNNTDNSTSNINYQLSQQHNPILSFQSMIPPIYPPLIGLSASSSKAQQPSLEIPSTVKMGSVLEELGLSHAQHVNNNNNNNNMVSAAASLERINNNMGNPSVEWAQRITGTVVADNHNIDGSLSGIVAERVSNGSNKVVNSSNNKGPECAVAARTEGTVESWINCSYD